MKKLVVSLLIVIATVATVQAREIKQGTFQMSGASNLFFGNTEFETDGEKYSDTDSLQLETTAFYYVVPNVGFGLSLDYSNDDTSYWDGSSFETTELLIGPAIKGNIELNKTTNLFGSASIGYSSLEFENDSVTVLDADGFFAKVSGGLAIFPVDAVSLDLGVAYTFTSGDDAISDVDVDVTEISGFAGISVYF